jgi:hypothetical protein
LLITRREVTNRQSKKVKAEFMKYQTPANEIIEGINEQHAIQKLREFAKQTDKYYDYCYDWILHADGIHLIQNKKRDK